MSRYHSGISAHLPERVDDPKAWLAQVQLAIDDQPIGESAPCMNPECGRPVDFTGKGGPAPLYCSGRCRARASRMRERASQQLDVLEELLEATKHHHGVPREDLRARASLLRWWLTRLG